MKKLLSICLLIFFVMVFFVKSPIAKASEINEVTEIEARKAAIFQILLDMTAVPKPFFDDPNMINAAGENSIENEPVFIERKVSPWKGKKVYLGPAIEVYDQSDYIYSYLFSLTADNKEVGFLEVSASKSDYPIRSFAYEGVGVDIDKMKQMADSTQNQITSQKVVVLSPGQFGLKTTYINGSESISTPNGIIDISRDNSVSQEVHTRKNAHAEALWEEVLSQDFQPYDLGTPNDGVTDDLSFETGSISSLSLPNVPDLNQIYSPLWEGPSGCSPTSAANIMKFWASPNLFNRTYPLLTQGMTDAQLLLELRTRMQTDSMGYTPSPNLISEGMKSYGQSKYESANGWYMDFPTFTDYATTLFLYGPNVTSFYASAFYGDHSVTGVGVIQFFYDGSPLGHQYMEVHDNWHSTPTSVYVRWEDNPNSQTYQTLYLDLFSLT